MPAAEGIKFGSFVLLRRIARGGMAEVFLAQQRGLEGFDRRVAVKRILPHLADSSDFIRMFLGEAKLAAQLTHPNIVHIYEFGKVEQDYFIAMEYVDGVHAGQLMQAGETHPKISPTLVARLGADAAAALHYAHELKGPGSKPLGLVHRDVSPANIMISYDGIVKLVDFGIAKAAAATDQLTSPGQVKGKYAYMSPEQTVAQPLDGRSDVFALGIVLWELVTGKFIVPRGDAVVAMRMIRDGKLEPVLHAAPDTPPQLAAAINWALETKREKRATAAELAQALEAFIKQSPEIATPMQLGNWVRNHFVREVTGQLPSIAPQGTQAHPGTVAASQTRSQISIALTPDPDGPHGMIGASRLARRLADSGIEDPGKHHGDDSVDTLEILRNHKPFNAPTVIAPPQGPFTGSTTIAKEPFDDATSLHQPEGMRGEPFTPGGGGPTLIAPPPAHPDQEATVLAPGRLDPDQEMSDATETVQLDRHRMPPLPNPRQPFPLATQLVSPLSGPNVRVSEPIPPSGGFNALGSGPQPPPPGQPNALGFLNPWRTRPHMPDPVAQRQMRIASAIAGLVGLALISFLVALCATRSHRGAVAVAAQHDGGSVADAGASDAAEVALMQPADASAIAPTFPGDAHVATPPTSNEAYLEIVTFPEGGKVKVGDQVRTAPAQLVVQAGTFEVVGELAGYQDETRPVTIAPGEHFKVELTFNHHVGTGGHPAPATGKLSVRTTPYAEVFENGKKIGETPFADRELTVGPHTLVFKNPLHPAETRKVVIRADKPVKLSFTFRD